LVGDRAAARWARQADLEDLADMKAPVVRVGRGGAVVRMAQGDLAVQVEIIKFKFFVTFFFLIRLKGKTRMGLDGFGNI
jgi:hypothetical protein